MGLFLNIGNKNYAEFSQTQYFVDKSELINNLLKKDITEKFVCNSRARRFGKSVTADMLVAYFSKGVDSRSLFEPLKCMKDALFLESMNAYDTIFVDIQVQFKAAQFENEEPVSYISRKIVKELQEDYPDIVSGETALMNAVSEIYHETGSRFVIIFDEWDYPIRELDKGNTDRLSYIEMLRGLFKNNAAKSYIRLAYLTGIMPIVRTKGQSAVNNFMEYTMINPMDQAKDIGFTEEEVFLLCERFGVDFEQMKEWYNGYNLGGTAMYNPLSVVRAVSAKRFQQYWTVTGTYGDIDDLICKNFDGLREDIIRMLSGNRIPVEVDNGINDLQTFEDKEQVITALIHLGYCAYDEDTQEAYIPNKEIHAVFYKSVKKSKNDGMAQFMKLSEEILEAVMAGDGERTARLIQGVHNDFTSSIEYNDENSLSCTVMIALIAAFSYYHRPIREFPRDFQEEIPWGKGFADIVYMPRANHPNRPVIVVELKGDKSAEAAIAQIRKKQYPESLKDYAGEMLLVGIDYDKKTKEHTCVIERFC